VGRSEDRREASIEARVTMLEGDQDRNEAKIGKILTGLVLAATGLLTSTIMLLIEAVTK
jgi:hypothetical protein